MSHNPIIPAHFFERPATQVARDLIGAKLVRRVGTQRNSVTITETEAYEGVHDLASHSSKGRTVRTEIMFGPAGRFYVYRIYGVHWMLNVVTGEIGDASAVLIRAVEGIIGPGRLTSALRIDSSLDGRRAAPASGLWFEDRQDEKPPRVKRTARIGVEYAGPVWAKKKLRFLRF